MGRFLVSRAENGVVFTLYSETGRVLAASKPYANLDACKKAIRSLVRYAPVCPVVLRDEGRHANPKFALCEMARGFRCEMLAPNGKAVLSVGPFATKKACLRTVSMLRTGVENATVELEQGGSRIPLKLGESSQ